MMLDAVLPSKACLPVTSSYNTQPSAKMSVRMSASCPSICSGAMVLRRPEDRVRTRERRDCGLLACLADARLLKLRQPEIEKLDAALRRQDVRRLQVAMDDAFLVRCSECVADLNAEFNDVAHTQWTWIGAPSTYSRTR